MRSGTKNQFGGFREQFGAFEMRSNVVPRLPKPARAAERSAKILCHARKPSFRTQGKGTCYQYFVLWTNTRLIVEFPCKSTTKIGEFTNKAM